MAGQPSEQQIRDQVKLLQGAGATEQKKSEEKPDEKKPDEPNK